MQHVLRDLLLNETFVASFVFTITYSWHHKEVYHKY